MAYSKEAELGLWFGLTDDPGTARYVFWGFVGVSLIGLLISLGYLTKRFRRA